MTAPIVYSFMGAKQTGITPLCRLMVGDGPYAWMADEVLSWTKANRKPLLITRCDPQVKPEAANEWPTEWLTERYGAFARTLKKHGVKIAAVVDSADFERTPENDNRYYAGCIRPLLDVYPDLRWCNYATPPGTLLGDAQSILAPCLYLFDGFEPANPPRTPEQVAEWSLDTLASYAAAGKPMIPLLGSTLVARKDVPESVHQSHLRAVMAKSDTIILFDQTGEPDDDRKRGYDEGKATRREAVALAKQLKAAA